MDGRRTLISSTLVYAFTNALSAAIPFLILPVLTRVLTPEEYGRVAMFSIVLGVFGAFAGLNVHGAVSVRYFDHERTDFPRYVASCLMVLAGSTASVVIITWAALPWIRMLTGLPGSWLLVAAGVAGAQCIVQIQLAIWQSARQPWRYGASRMMQSFVDATLSLLFVLLMGLGWQGRIGGISVAVVITGMMMLITMRRSGWIQLPASKTYAVEAMRFGVPLVPNALGALMIGLGDRFIVSQSLGIEDLGIYTIAWQISLLVGMLADSFVRAYGPWLYERLQASNSEASLQVVGFTYGAFALFSLLSLVVFVVISTFAHMFLGANFLPAVDILPWFLAGNAFLGMYYTVIGLVFFSGKTEFASLITVISGSIGMASVFVLSRIYGMHGAACGFLIGNIVAFVLAWFCGRQLFDLPWKQFGAACGAVLDRKLQ